MDESKREYYSQQVELLETMQLVWNLCEILFIDITPGKHDTSAPVCEVLLMDI